MMKSALLALALSLSAAAHAQAPAAPAAPATSPAKKELIGKLIALQRDNYEALARNLVNAPAMQLRQQALTAMQRMPQDRREAAARGMEDDLRKYVDEAGAIAKAAAAKVAGPTVSPLLEQRLSEDELKQMISIIESPAFRKYLSIDQEISRALSEKIVAETRPTIGPKVQALQQAMERELRAANAAAPASAPSTGK